MKGREVCVSEVWRVTVADACNVPGLAGGRKGL